MASGTKRKRYQYCGFKKSNTPIAKYSNVDCIKSTLFNTFSDGRQYVQDFYISKNIGIVATISLTYSSSGKLLSKEMEFLSSTNF